MEPAVELSLDNGIKGSSENKRNRDHLAVRFSTACPTLTQVLSPGSSFELLPPTVVEDKDSSLMPEDDNGDSEFEGDTDELVRNYKSQKRELIKTRKAVEELKKENQLKTRECQEALRSLQELQSELMRKSMHVGSLAFAIEGQVKEKSRWFSSLRDLTRKLKIMKMEQIKLSKEAAAYKKCVEDVSIISSTIQSKMNEQEELHKDLTVKFVEGAKRRKELYNKVLELKGNIRVFCRCRPLNEQEVTAEAPMAVDFESSSDGDLTVKSNGAFRKTYKFDAVFGPQADQADVFKDTAPFATSVLDGYNVCIFAYGQTGTGKTYTMEGTEEARGVNYSTLEELFHIIKEREQIYQYDITVSVLEVYNEQIRDLLASGTQSGPPAKRLEIRQSGEGTHHVPGLTEAHVNNMNEVWEVLQTGSNARAIGSTNSNEHSSRSHCIHCVMVKGENLLNGECTKSKLWLVDLAGSERIAKTEVQGERLKETQNINRSLSALGDVISALATKSPHIPFRNSKLTHLLQDSLGGDSKALMFVQISPNENDISETICSLNFASRVKGVELGSAKKQLDTAELVKYKQMFEKAKQDLKIKDMQMKKMEETVQSLDLKVKDRDLKAKNLQEKVKELEAQLLVERKLARQHVDTKIAEQHQQMKLQDEQNVAMVRPPLMSRQPSSLKDPPTPSLAWPLMENNNGSKPLLDGFPKYTDVAEKENNPVWLEQPLIPKRTGRASLCPIARANPLGPAPRRISMIPLPTASGLKSGPRDLTPLPLQPISFPEKDEEEVGGYDPSCLPDKIPTDSPRGTKSGVKKLSNILRRSIHRKMKSPMQIRRGGVNVGMERVRVSIGSRGRIAAHKALLGNGKAARAKELQQKQSQKEKERGWNIGTGRTLI
ncbi:hypothetical protein CRG98_031949 [Punica granatum]|nr:hypothetical protein CRG98_031949 [Punica granatum]